MPSAAFMSSLVIGSFRELGSHRHHLIRNGLARKRSKVPTVAPICCSSSKTPLPASTASFTDVSEDTRFYIVGCVHGSQASEADVTTVLDATSPDAVVLELCDSRLRTLRSSLSQLNKFEPVSKVLQSGKKQSFAQISKTFGGAGPAVIALFLDTIYRLQVFSGVDPGIEFAEPIRRYESNRVICGDAPANETVRRLFDVFSSPFQSVATCWSAITDIIERVVFPPVGGINMAAVFLSDSSRVLELVQLMIPASVVAVVLTLVGNAGALALEGTPVITELSQATTGAAFTVLWTVFQTLSLIYIFVSTLRFMKVLIADRDRILTQNILLTAAKMRNENEGPVTICAVVGLLHVNGILKLLIEQTAET